MGAWAMLKKSRGRTWRVTGGAVEKEFFFDDSTPEQIAEYKAGKRWRIMWSDTPVLIGAIVTLNPDGSICWPTEARP